MPGAFGEFARWGMEEAPRQEGSSGLTRDPVGVRRQKSVQDICVEKGVVVSRAGGGYGFDQNQWVGLAEGTGSRGLGEREKRLALRASGERAPGGGRQRLREASTAVPGCCEITRAVPKEERAHFLVCAPSPQIPCCSTQFLVKPLRPCRASKEGALREEPGPSGSCPLNPPCGGWGRAAGVLHPTVPQ